MVAESAVERIKSKRKCAPRKIIPAQITALNQRGFTTREIAKQTGVAPSTVWRFLDKTDEEKIQLEKFKANRADAFADLQGKAINVQAMLIESITKDGVLETLAPQTKAQLLTALNNVQGTIYDKERLERGESTANVSTVSRMISGEVGALYKAKPLIPLRSGKAKKVADPV